MIAGLVLCAALSLFSPEAFKFAEIETSVIGEPVMSADNGANALSVSDDGLKEAVRLDVVKRGAGLTVTHNGGRDYYIVRRDGKKIYKRASKNGDIYADGDGTAWIKVETLTKELGFVLSDDAAGRKLWEAEAFNAAGGWRLLSEGYVAHAAGAYDMFKQQNAFEIMRWNYNRGWRVFEMDFCLTSDGKLAVVHDWDGYNGVKTAAEWKKIKLADHFTTMLAEDLFAFMAERPDMYLITDTKSYALSDKETAKQFAAMVEAARSVDITVMERVVPQIYNAGHYALFKKAWNFRSIIYTLYADKSSDDKVIAFVADKPDIAAVTMPPERLNEKLTGALSKMGKRVYIHTVNDPKLVETYAEKGAAGFYSDYLPLEWRTEDPYYKRVTGVGK